MKTPDQIAADAAHECVNWGIKARCFTKSEETDAFSAIIARHIAPLVARVKELEAAVIDEVENSVRGRGWTDQETGKTDSGALSSVAQDLRLLAENGRFRIVSECGRMVVGYWPENDPEKKQGAAP